VYVEKKLPKPDLGSDDLLPASLDEIPVDVVEIGRPIPYRYDTRQRPAMGGDSIGHVDVSAGTLGCLMRDKTDGEVVILSCNHILAARDAVGHPAGAAGDCVLQPGVLDGGTCPCDRIAELKRWVPLVEIGSGTNEVDAAIAAPLCASDVRNSIRDIGCISEWRDVLESDVSSSSADPDNVQKSGRTTEYTTGRIIDIDATISISYGGFTAQHDNVIVTDNMASPGDSGSLLVDMDKKAVGLLYGGSPGSVVFYNPIARVLDALDVEFLSCIHACFVGPIPPTCVVGGPWHCRTGGPFVCRLGGPETSRHCDIGGPDRPVYCGIGGPDNQVHCLVGSPDNPYQCLNRSLGQPCRSGGPLHECRIGPGRCGAGPVIGCGVGPGDIEVIDPEELVSIKGELLISTDQLEPKSRKILAELVEKLRQN
jgi:hypothetical protein